MARLSTVERLPRELRDQLNDRIRDGATAEELVEITDAAGQQISLSAMTRYRRTKRTYYEVIDRERTARSITMELEQEFGTLDDQGSKLLLYLMRSAITDRVSLAASDPDEFDDKQLVELSKGVKNIVASMAIDAKREAEIRAEERANAAKVAESSMRQAGATQETIDRVKRELLGFSTPVAAATKA